MAACDDKNVNTFGLLFKPGLMSFLKKIVNRYF